MADLHKELLEEQFSDSALLLLMDEYAEAEGENLLSHYEETMVQMPPELDKTCQMRIQKLYKNTEKSALLRRTVYRGGKIAAAVLIIFSLSANLILSVEAIRVPLLNLCIKTQKYFSSITFPTEQGGSSDSDKDVVNLPISIPKGYSLMHKDHNHDDYSYIYEDSTLFLAYQDQEGHYFMFQTLPAQGALSIDTEDAESVEFLLNGMQAIQIRQESDHTLRTLWVDPDRQRLFDVSCNGMKEEEFKQHVLDLSAMMMAPELYAD